MLERRSAANGVVYYASPLLEAAGVPHAFSTRIGGLSPAPFDSLNLGNPSGCEITDDYERIWENYRLLAGACGCSSSGAACGIVPACRDYDSAATVPPAATPHSRGRLCHIPSPGVAGEAGQDAASFRDSVLRVHQVHGGVVARAIAGRPFDTHFKADAIVSDDPHRIASVRVADCVPVLLARADGKTVAAVHAGWRGVIAGIVTAALRELLHRDGQAATVLAAIGPCIGYDAFEVGPEVLEEFRNHFGRHAPLRTVEGGKGFVDLRAAIRLQLLMAGVADERIDKTDRCTYRHREEFYSHRRENGVTGRMAAIISARV